MRIKFFFRYFFIATYLLIYAVSNAQMMGQWRTHLPYNNVTKVEQTPNLVFGLSNGALFSVTKEDKLLKTYSKVDGLSDNNISLIKYNEAKNLLFIAYANSNIDLLIGEQVYNIPDIKNKIIYTSKTINDIYFYNNFAYLSCDFGIVVINLQKREVADTYIIGNNGAYLPIKSVVIKGDKIYALTASALYSANKNNPLLANYQNWTQETTLPAASFSNKSLLLFNDVFYLAKSNGEVYTASTINNWSLFDWGIVGMKISNAYLLLYNSDTVKKYNNTFEVEQAGYTVADVVYSSSENCYWIADWSRGISQFKPGISTQSFYLDGPVVLPCYDMTFLHNRLYVVSGAWWENQTNGYPGALMILTESGWKNITSQSIGRSFDYTTHVAVDKADGTHYFVSVWGDGVYEFKNDLFFTKYDQNNSTLEHHNVSGDYDSIRTDGVCFDKKNHLWVTNQYASDAIKVRLYTGEWLSIPNTNMIKRTVTDKVLVGNNNYKWFNIPSNTRNPGILVLDDKGDPTATNSHRSKWFSTFIDQDGNTLSTGYYYCMAEDKNNSIWVGTDQGPIVFQSVSNVFNSNYAVTRIKIPREDGTSYADYLLENEKIKCIAIDGGNRKWFGTENSGVYLMSDDGKKSIHHFTKENSPLLSNTILSMAINPKSGEVFFGTNLGIISYMSDASEGTGTYSNVYAYPNPVRPTYNGLITITGLLDESTVRITDTTGSLVFQTTSNGGIATWDGKNALGKRVASGVYIAMCSDKNGEQYTTTKILFIN